VTGILSPKTAKSRQARFSVASITNIGGKGSLREGQIALMTAAPALHCYQALRHRDYQRIRSQNLFESGS
jgi:hypothetical protein